MMTVIFMESEQMYGDKGQLPEDMIQLKKMKLKKKVMMLLLFPLAKF